VPQGVAEEADADVGVHERPFLRGLPGLEEVVEADGIEVDVGVVVVPESVDQHGRRQADFEEGTAIDGALRIGDAGVTEAEVVRLAAAAISDKTDSDVAWKGRILPFSDESRIDVGRNFDRQPIANKAKTANSNSLRRIQRG
jgi:hypothetical protein